mgnify:CR=1 FL=1|jgi:hypothetical protein
MQVVDNNGNVFGTGLEINGPNGKPKTTGGGGGSPSGPAGGDLSGTYPNPTVNWSNGLSTYNLQYYPLSSNPSGYITSSALTPYLTSALAATTYYPIPTGTTSQYLRGDGTLATFPTIPGGTVTAVTGSSPISSTGGTTPAISIAQSNTSTNGYLSSTDWNTFNNKQATLVSGTNIKTVNSTSLLGSGDVAVQATLVSGTNIKTINSTSLLGSGDIAISTAVAVGTTAVTSGTIGRIFFQDTGNVVQQDSNLFWDNTNKRLGVGATPSTSVRLDVRAQGALSTDIAFRVRNSANTQDLLKHQGDGYWIYRNNAGTNYILWDAAGTFEIGTSGSHSCSMTTSSTISRIITISPIQSVQVASHGMYLYNNGNLQIEETTGILQTSGRGGISLKNAAVVPSTNTTDRFTMYSTDIVAGNAAPHFRTENGDIVKLYRVAGWGLPTGTFTRTTFDTATVTTAQLAERVAALIQDLRDNHGLLKA